MRNETETLREHYTNELARYSELTGPVRINLETEYMMMIGRKEYQLFSLEIELRRCKREIALYQAAANRGEQAAAKDIRAALEGEFAEYRAVLEERRKALKNAEEIFGCGKMTPEKSGEIQKVYRTLVKKLHPDLNPGLPPQAGTLWNRIVNAYKSGYWQELYLLSDLADELLNGKNIVPPQLNSLDALRELKNSLTEKLAALKKTIEELQERPPFCYSELLNSPEKIAEKRLELDQKIEEMKKFLNEVKQLLKNIRSE